MKDLTILLIRYLEPYGKQIYDLVQQVDCKKVMVNRNPAGIGSLAEVINRGIKEVKTEFCWIVTNNTFASEAPELLLDHIKSNDRYAAVHPVFNSDHEFLRPTTKMVARYAPYVEFTSPIVRTKVLKGIQLDENMPYWGHDLDWGYRVREENYLIGVSSVEIKHVYIRDQKDKHHITRERWSARVATNQATRKSLIKKYGHNWREVLGYK